MLMKALTCPLQQYLIYTGFTIYFPVGGYVVQEEINYNTMVLTYKISVISFFAHDLHSSSSTNTKYPQKCLGSGGTHL